MFSRLLVLVVVLLTACAELGGAVELADRGVLDLQELAAKSPPTAVSGAWRFQEGLHAPGVPLTGPRSLYVPGPWTDSEPAVMDSPFGDGTYELAVVGRRGRGFVLEVESAGAADAYVNGRLVDQLGRLAGPDGEASVDGWGPLAIPLPEGDDALVVRVLVSNRAVRVGGLTQAVVGHSPLMERRAGRRMLFDVVNVAVLGTFGMVFLIIAFRKRDDLSYLFFALLCLDLGLRDLVGGSGDITDLLVPELTWASRIRIEYLTLPLGVIFGLGTVTQLTGILRKHWVTLGFYATAGMLALAHMFVPVSGLGYLLSVSQIVMLISGLFVGGLLVYAATKGDRRSLQFLGAFMLFVAAMVHDVLLSLGVINTGIRVGTIGFITVMAAFGLLLIGDFVTSFLLNRQLAVDLQQTNDDLERTHESVLRFVPDAFLRLLGKTSVVEVERGDHTEEELEILFCDLRGFTTLIEGLGPERAFPFINRYLQHMEPPITQNGGFISQYLGDCIMALFTNGPDLAVEAAVEMSRALDRFNATEPEGPVSFGIGMASGALMLGTIGGDKRLDGGVIGDSVNHASRLEGMTKMYGTVLLIDESTRGRLTADARFILREVDRVIAKGRTQASSIFEVLDALPGPIRQRRIEGLAVWNAALVAYKSGKFEEAGAGFSVCADQDPDDKAARVMVERCQHLRVQGAPAGWDGTTRLATK
ncbi:MAG: adenylate/guanylate cyclase domain-containing protein [Myxococcota bacterium]